MDASSGGTQQPQPAPVTVTRTSVLVTGGIFTVQLDFGASTFPGADRFLDKSEGEQVGFSAQSVQKLIPEAVTKNDKGYLLVSNDPIMKGYNRRIQRML